MKTTTKTLSALAGLALIAGSAQAAPITVTGFDHDWILASGETVAANLPSPANFIWYAADSGVATGTYPGFAASGAQTVDSKDFQLQSYTSNNVLYAGKTYAATDPSDTQNTLTLVTPGQFTEISVLGSKFGNGTTGNSMTINFSDASNSGAININFPVWAAAVSGPNDFDAGITNNGTTAAYDGTVGVVTYDLAANGFSGKTVESITFTSTDPGGAANGNDGFGVFGVSGVPVPEPGSLALLGLGGLLIARRRRD